MREITSVHMKPFKKYMKYPISDFSDLEIRIPAPFFNPNVPRNISAVYLNGGVSITWKAPLDAFQELTHYAIQIKSGNSEWKEIPEHIYPPTTSYFTLDVMPDTEYRLRVYAVDDDIYIGASDDVVITTSSGQFARPE